MKLIDNIMNIECKYKDWNTYIKLALDDEKMS